MEHGAMSEISKVWFIPVEDAAPVEEQVRHLGVLIRRCGLVGSVPKGGGATIKMHFGEEGNRGYIRPALVRAIADAITGCGCRVSVSDTNTLYRGRRTNSRDHLQLAREHGFHDGATGGSVEIPDETEPGTVVSAVVENGKFFSEVKVMRAYMDTAFLLGLAHFKGHMVSGFGGALKNIGMGCAAREGKLAQHASVAPYIIMKNCIGCGACRRVCPADAVEVVNGKATLDPQKCIGCASCIAACKSDAVELDWSGGAGSLPEKMVEYAGAVLRAPGKKWFVNVVTKVTAECDCMAGDDPSIVPDVGMLISEDPVAVDQASYDLVCRKAGGYDPFRKAHPRRDGLRQLDYAERMGIGRRRYELITVDTERK